MITNKCTTHSNNKSKKTTSTNHTYDTIIVNESLQVIAKGTGIILTGTIIGTILAALFPIIIARSYSPTDFGVYALAMTVFIFLGQIFILGLGDGCSRNIAFYRGKKNHKKVKEIITSSFKITVVSSIIGSIFLFLSADWISLNIFHTNTLIIPLKILSFALPFQLLIDIIVSTFRGFDRTKENVYFYHFLMSGGKLLMVIPIVILGLSFEYIFYVFVMNMIMTFLIATFYFKRNTPKEIKEIKRSGNSIKKDLLIFSIPLVFSGMSWFLLQGADRLMIGFFMKEYNVGIYNTACSIAGYLNMFLVSTMFIYQPVGTKLYGAGKMLEVKKLYQTITKWIFILASPVIMFIVLQPEVTISFLFGSKYLGATFPLLILFLTYTLRIWLGPAGGSIIMLGKTRQLMCIVASMALINIILNWFLIPIYGISGAAIATGISVIILSFLQLVYLYKISKIHPIRKVYLKIITVFLSLTAIVYLLFQYLPITFSLPAKIILIIVSYFLFFVLLIVFNLFREEDLLIVKLIERKLGIKIPFVRKIIR